MGHLLSAHNAMETDTVDLLKRETPDFIPPLLWHPNLTPDLNPVDYQIISSEFTAGNPNELRQRIIEEWKRLDQRVIDNAV